ncbi:glycosyl transferase group 1 [Isosphaera pallida ATCC 43644]|uniref:Glycosyl transferase group 1 n=1 Tax=Isosphaera pallida (strain ATCC 43644 / DSM 9630 / IS1B) TaxID=575540 RepID=E8R181_ISOPI|nr:glycosyltransferase family 4 protein [Isosphaera pallida]ADV61287.1 glycosyl transferase group 1 [Isosphaera pallida ATCC 43644]
MTGSSEPLTPDPSRRDQPRPGRSVATTVSPGTEPIPILLLEGPLDSWMVLEQLRRLMDRLDRRGFETWAFVSRLPAGIDPVALEREEAILSRQALSLPWLRPLALRRLPWGPGIDGGDPPRPRLIHALQRRLCGLALDLAEHWGIPYYVSVPDFPPDQTRLRLSRRWCQGLIASIPEVAEALVETMAIPAEVIVSIDLGMDPHHAVPPPMDPPLLKRPPVEDSQTAPDLSHGLLDPYESHPGIPIDFEPPEPIEPARRALVVGTTGRGLPRDGLDLFLIAARRVLDAGLDAEFVISPWAGPLQEEELLRRAEWLKLSDRLTFVGHENLIPMFWNVLDLYCQPNRMPTVGRALIRARLEGLPVVASDLPGLSRQIHHDQDGLLVPPRDADALAKAMITLLSDPQRAARLGRAARARALAEHDPDQAADRLAAHYRLALERETQPGPFFQSYSLAT